MVDVEEEARSLVVVVLSIAEKNETMNSTEPNVKKKKCTKRKGVGKTIVDQPLVKEIEGENFS